MPVTLTRIDLERRFVDDWYQMRSGFADELIDQMGAPPNSYNIDPVFWQDVHESHEEVAKQNIGDIFGRSASAVVGLTATLGGIAVAYAADRAIGMSRDALAGLRKAIVKMPEDQRAFGVKSLNRAISLGDRLQIIFDRLLASGATDTPDHVMKKLEQMRGHLFHVVRYGDLLAEFRNHFASASTFFSSILEQVIRQALGESSETLATRSIINHHLRDDVARRQVVTETTRAVFQGTETAARESGLISVDDTWTVKDDDSLCSLCRPLSGKPRVVWVLQYPQGPPIHFNCRCQPQYKNASQLPYNAQDLAAA